MPAVFMHGARDVRLGRKAAPSPASLGPGEVLVDVFERLSDDERHKAVGRCPTHVAPLRELGISGWWAQYARAVGGAATSRRDGASRASAPIFRSSSSRFYWDGTERSLDAARAALCRGPRPES